MKRDIFVICVGGQGIGLLSETIIRAADYAGFGKSVDTHGCSLGAWLLACKDRRGVFSHLLCLGRQTWFCLEIQKH